MHVSPSPEPLPSRPGVLAHLCGPAIFCSPAPPTLVLRTGTRGWGLKKEEGPRAGDQPCLQAPPPRPCPDDNSRILPWTVSTGRTLEILRKAGILSGLENLGQFASFPNMPQDSPQLLPLSQLRGQGGSTKLSQASPLHLRGLRRPGQQGGARPPRCPGLVLPAPPVPEGSWGALVTAEASQAGSPPQGTQGSQGGGILGKQPPPC